jgi:Cu+-exporting ATPase
VNFANEKVTFTYDPAVVKGQEVTTAVIERVKRAGYEIPYGCPGTALAGHDLRQLRPTSSGRLNKVDGVLSATVNYANEKAVVRYLRHGCGEPGEMVAAVRRAGYDVVESASDDESRRRRSRRPRSRDQTSGDPAHRGHRLFAAACFCLA